MKSPERIKRDSFYQAVYDVVRSIPKGRVSTYGTIARFLGTGSSSRMVGYALNNCVTEGAGDIPAHRVVNRLGLLSGSHHFSSENPMEARLAEEGILVKEGQVVDFKTLLWDPVIGPWPEEGM